MDYNGARISEDTALVQNAYKKANEAKHGMNEVEGGYRLENDSRGYVICAFDVHEISYGD